MQQNRKLEICLCFEAQQLLDWLKLVMSPSNVMDLTIKFRFKISFLISWRCWCGSNKTYEWIILSVFHASAKLWKFKVFLHFQLLLKKSFFFFNEGLQNRRETPEACSGTVSRVSEEPLQPDTVTSWTESHWLARGSAGPGAHRRKICLPD